MSPTAQLPLRLMRSLGGANSASPRLPTCQRLFIARADTPIIRPISESERGLPRYSKMIGRPFMDHPIVRVMVTDVGTPGTVLS